MTEQPQPATTAAPETLTQLEEAAPWFGRIPAVGAAI